MTQQIDNLKGPKVRLSTVATSTRQTAKTDFGTVMRNGLIKAGNVAVEGMRIAAPFVPGGAIVSAAVSGANLATDLGQGAYGATAGGIGTSAAGLSMGGGGPTGGNISPGNYNATGALSVPGRRPGLGTDLGQPASNMAGGAYGAGAGAGTTASGASDSFNQMMTATRSMAEFQASFNLQYLQLQEKIQTDTRQFNLVSNIMKTKHDAAKNALNNVR